MDVMVNRDVLLLTLVTIVVVIVLGTGYLAEYQTRKALPGKRLKRKIRATQKRMMNARKRSGRKIAASIKNRIV